MCAKEREKKLDDEAVGGLGIDGWGRLREREREREIGWNEFIRYLLFYIVIIVKL